MLGEHDKAGGVAVEAVDTAVDEGFTFLFKIPCNAVCQRIFIISNRRMNRRISGFIHNEDVVILIHNRKRNRPRQNSVGGLCFDKVRFDHIPGVHGLARPGADAVSENAVLCAF